MAGISGVVTMPEARNRGMVREQFKAMQRDMVEQGYLTSCLEPFKPKILSEIRLGECFEKTPMRDKCRGY